MTTLEMYKLRVWRGAIVMLDTGVQAVVQRAVDGEPVTVVATGGGVAHVTLAQLRVLDVPKKLDHCSVCGDVWVRHGDRTSHCGGCHETFEGGALWDAHRILGAGDKFVCRRAASMEFKRVRLRKVADPVDGFVTVGTWRGPKFAGFGGDDE